MILQGDALEELRKAAGQMLQRLRNFTTLLQRQRLRSSRSARNRKLSGGIHPQAGGSLPGSRQSPERRRHPLAEYRRQLREAYRGRRIKRKDLIGIPWLLALALRSDGWYLRADIIWNKPNAMPESAKDRPARSHEYVFLLSKAAAYYYDAEAVKELAVGYDPKKPGRKRGNAKTFRGGTAYTHDQAKANSAEVDRGSHGPREMKPANETAGTSGRSPHGHIKAPTSPRSRRNWPRSAYWPGANRATRFWIHSQEVEPQEPQPSKKGGTISG